MNIPINIKLPTTWNELSPKQLGEVAYILEYFRAQEKTRQQDFRFYVRFYFQLVKQLLRSEKWYKVYIAIRQIPPMNYKKHVEFLLHGVSRTSFPKKLKAGKHTMLPPADKLKNISIEEFSFADALFYRWQELGNDEYLQLLCATLYRPKGGNEYDPREPFNKVMVEKRFDCFNKVPYKKQLAIGYTYLGCRNHIVSLYPHIFPKPYEPKEEEEKKPRPKPKYVPFGRLINFKVKFDPSKIEATEKINVHKFLSNYENELIELKKQKK
ncbi:hypothetical protein MG296_10515 [Flavobacteriaceae bacterium TK19130]|nr:hypothetical protein [Thermobacterium salinum]